MKIADIMSRPPLAVSPTDGRRLLERLLTLGRVHHLPVIDDGRLVGMWLSDDHGRIRMVGADEIVQTAPQVPAEDAVAELLAGKQAILVWDGAEPVGVLTHADVLNILRAALARGIGRRYPRPVVVRLTGPASGGKTALLLRTVPLLRHVTIGVVQADDNAEHVAATSSLGGARVVTAPRAQFRTGLAKALEELEDVQLVLFEDRGGPAVPARALGEDHEVLVMPVTEALGLGADELAEALTEASALVVTKLDSAPSGFDLEELRKTLQARRPGMVVLGVAAALDDRGLLEWRDWLLGCVLPASG